MGKRSFDELDLAPDARYNSKLVSKFVNCLMQGGKKSKAQKVFYEAMERVAEQVEEDDPGEIFEQAISNVQPVVEVRGRRIGGMTYQVPTEVSGKRRVALAIRWILEAAKSKKGRPLNERLADEILDAFKKQGSAYQKRESLHRMAEANRAFAHFRI
jgi:small subunit ribosomal protein S7